MSEKNAIYEITRKMSNNSVVQNDMNEAADLVMQMFKDKYFNKLYSAISEYHNQCLQDPSKEVQLLHAFKPFLPDRQKENLDQLIQIMLFRDTAESVKKELGINKAPQSTGTGEKLLHKTSSPIVAAGAEKPPGASIHEDGVYDVDQFCLNRKQQTPSGFPNLLLMMALMMQ